MTPPSLGSTYSGSASSSSPHSVGLDLVWVHHGCVASCSLLSFRVRWCAHPLMIMVSIVVLVSLLAFPPLVCDGLYVQNNYSFSGECGPLSKLVIIVIMLRGRHRTCALRFISLLKSSQRHTVSVDLSGGLPVAVDRSSASSRPYVLLRSRLIDFVTCPSIVMLPEEYKTNDQNANANAAASTTTNGNGNTDGHAARASTSMRATATV